MSKEEQEAERIIKRFYPLTYTAAIKPYSDKDAIRCAIIHVEGIINLLHHDDVYKEMLNWDNMHDYWQEVLTILNNK